MFFSIIIPVYNRPEELREILGGLLGQTYKNFEVLVVESGSDKKKSDIVVGAFASKMNVKYLLTGNFGPGISRNFGMKQANGDYFVILDSDILVEPEFLQNIYHGVTSQNLDCHGGPDKCHPTFSDIEKAFNYSLTSFLTTGGMRGGVKTATQFHPRSFNMGFSRKVYEATGGFPFGFMGEDIVLSLKIRSLGFKIALIPDAFVYHHRKKDFKTFFKNMQFFGKARINITKNMPGSLKIVHLLPVGFIIYLIATYLSVFISGTIFIAMKAIFYTYFALVFIDSTYKNKNMYIGFLSVLAVFVQFMGYGIGFLQDFWKRIVLNDKAGITNI